MLTEVVTLDCTGECRKWTV